MNKPIKLKTKKVDHPVRETPQPVAGMIQPPGSVADAIFGQTRGSANEVISAMKNKIEELKKTRR